MAEIKYTYKRYNGTSWDILYPKTTAEQVNQSTTKVFLHPTTNTINGKSFGTLSNGVWSPAAITLSGSDLQVGGGDTDTIQSAISKLKDKTSTGVAKEGSLIANYLIVGASEDSIKDSAYKIGNFDATTGEQNSIPSCENIRAFLEGENATTSYTGSSKITKVGTITSGTWNGTTIAIANGGTGATTAAGARTNLGLGAAATRSVIDDASGITSTSTGLVAGKAIYNAISKINSVTKIVCSTAANTPEGVTFTPKGSSTAITGTLKAANADKLGLYLVYHNHDGNDSYDEYTTVLVGDASTGTYSWEKIGNTDVKIDLSGYVKKGSLFNSANAGSITVINAAGDGLDSKYFVCVDSDDIKVDNGTIPTAGYVNRKYLAKNTAITAATKCKITYDANGLVTKGENLVASDIPSLASNKITAMTGYTKGSSVSAIATSDSLNVAIAKLENRIDAAGNTISGYGTRITNLENNPVIFYNTAAANVTGMKTGDFLVEYAA